MKLVILLFFTTFTLVSQNIKGVVLDLQSDKPLENVNVYLNTTKKGTVTNIKGVFYLKSNISNNDTIQFSMISYTSKKITFLELIKANYVVYLSQKIENLEQVVLTSNKTLNPKLHFKKLSSLDYGLHSFASALVDSKIYVIGGDASYIEYTEKRALDKVSKIPGATFNDLLKEMRMNASWENYKGDLQMYDINKNEWTSTSLKFRKRAYNKLNYFNGKLYILGGKTFSINRKKEYLDDKIEIFNLKDNTITIDDTNPHQAVNFESFVYGNNIMVLGGSLKLNKNGEKIYTNKSHIYNLKTGFWYELKDMLSAKEVKGILINNKIYLIGGFNGKPISEIESYNITTGKWNKEGQLFTGIENPALTYNNDIIYIFDYRKMLTYNINTKELNEYNIDLFLKASELYYYNNKIYILGGFIQDEFSKTPSSKLYSIVINEFLKTKVVKSKKIDSNIIVTYN
ncbi:MAG TPA: carboxypeptidase-like regulatory domain-containing protein [Flavobacteriaceae bacterium]|nr:carboxypeptidase-like regulatory domain-containing protein [Flavobacteriaceae bacterium]